MIKHQVLHRQHNARQLKGASFESFFIVNAIFYTQLTQGRELAIPDFAFSVTACFSSGLEARAYAVAVMPSSELLGIAEDSMFSSWCQEYIKDERLPGDAT